MSRRRSRPLGWRIYRGLKRLVQASGSNPDSRRRCSAKGVGADAVRGLRRPGGNFGQGWPRDIESYFPLIATHCARSNRQSGRSQDLRARRRIGSEICRLGESTQAALSIDVRVIVSWLCKIYNRIGYLVYVDHS
jgi:hypothetical protein